jgi:hypothetical protein
MYKADIYALCNLHIYKDEPYPFDDNMDVNKLVGIIDETTKVYRKGEEVTMRQEDGLRVVEVYGYPHTTEAPSKDGFEKTDMVFVDVVVDKEKAAKHKDEFLKIIRDYPEPERLKGGPSYIELAGTIGIEQETAFRMMALGRTLGLWSVITPGTLMRHASDEVKRELAGNGMIMISGFRELGKATDRDRI